MLGRVMSILMLSISLSEMAAFALAGVLADWRLWVVFLLGGLMMAIALLAWMTTRQDVEAVPVLEEG
jgi:hypothetical protein